jgi:ABC-type Zn uptake system ZnuABC Zn-binding protein ZnuA
VAYAGIKLLDVPQTVSRAGGDIHVFGNPHIHTDPLNGILIARNIAAGLKRLDPTNAAAYDANLGAFEDRVLRRLFGDELVEMLGGEQLLALGRDYRFWEFAASQTFQGRPLTDYIGGWLAAGAPFRDRRMVCYHKNWEYFSARFRVACAMYVEPRPGIPPAPGHVGEVIEFIKVERIPVIYAANYFSRSQVERVASRTGARAVVVPEHVGGEDRVDDYLTLIDRWVTGLAAGFGAARHR